MMQFKHTHANAFAASSGQRAIRLHANLVVVAAAKRQQKKKRKGPQQPVEDRIIFLDDVDDQDEFFMEAPRATAMPKAPAPSDTGNVNTEEAPKYRVFAPKPSSIEQIRGGAWGWDEEDAQPEAAAGPPIPEWNPRTGFMTSASDKERGESGAGASTSGANTAEVQTSFILPVSADAPLPAVPKDQILSSCFGTSLGMTIAALFLRSYAQANASQVLGTSPRLLSEVLQIPPGYENWQNVGLAIGAVALVTGARLQLMEVWPEFKTATNRSNKQILDPLGWFDILLVATLTGFSEELLFRGAIIPASFPDWRGAIIAGVIFGLLHNSGGRNPAFAAWASAVGIFYGGLFVYTHNIWVPVTAHALANFCSAVSWKLKTAPKTTD